MVVGGETFHPSLFVRLFVQVVLQQATTFNGWVLSSLSSPLSTQTAPGQDGFAVPCYFLLWPIKTKLSLLVELAKSFWLVQLALTYVLCVMSSHQLDSAAFLKRLDKVVSIGRARQELLIGPIGTHVPTLCHEFSPIGQLCFSQVLYFAVESPRLEW